MMPSPSRLIIRNLSSVIDLFLPQPCPGCRSAILNHQEHLCMHCSLTLPYTQFETLRNHPLEKLFWGRIPFGFASATWYFLDHSPIQHIIHAIKYEHQHVLGIHMGKQMGLRVQQLITDYPIDLLVPMPLHPKKEIKRGYNQAELLCKGIAMTTGIPIGNRAIQRTVQTKTQTRKSRSERWDNVHTAFSVAQPTAIHSKNIAIVDDVITTGASLEACGRSALLHGASSVSFLGMAFTA